MPHPTRMFRLRRAPRDRPKLPPNLQKVAVFVAAEFQHSPQPDLTAHLAGLSGAIAWPGHIDWQTDTPAAQRSGYDCCLKAVLDLGENRQAQVVVLVNFNGVYCHGRWSLIFGGPLSIGNPLPDKLADLIPRQPAPLAA